MKKFLTAIGVVFALALLLMLGVSVTVASPATYCVRKTGNDGDTGACPGNAWLTVDHAANTVVAGDIVYIGSGVYRETVTIDTSGTITDPIQWVGDIDGTHTGDSGLVVITVLADEVGAGGAGSVLNLNGKEYNEFYYLVFGPAGTGSFDYTIVGITGNSSYQGILFDYCTMLYSSDLGNATIKINYNVPASISGNKPTFRKCVILGPVLVEFGAMSADVACGIVIENCVCSQIDLDGPSSGTFGIEGYEIVNNTLYGMVDIKDQWNTGNTGVAANNFFAAVQAGVAVAGDGGTWTLTDDMSFGETARAGATPTIGALLGGWVEHILHKFYGWTPYRAFEPVYDMTGGDYKSGVIDLGSAVYAPATDMYGEVRPMLRGADDDVGAVEARARGEKEDTTFHGGALSLRFDGEGYHDAIIPVPAQAVTVTVWARYDGNYAGSLPQLKAYAIPGVADQTDTMVAAVNTWEQLEVNFTPTSAGYAIMRFVSRDTSANGKCFFDDADY